MERRNVDQMRKDLEQKRELVQLDQRILLQGFGSKFWSIIESDIKDRLKVAYKNLAGTRLTPESVGDLSYWQAEIHIFEQLLMLKELMQKEGQKTPGV